MRRPAILDELVKSVNEKPLTLLVAPGGSGKTTAMAWIAQESESKSVIWARLGSQDDDPLAISTLLVAALRIVDPQGGQRLERLLSLGGGFDTSAMAAAFANDLAQLGDLIVILDDFHSLTSSDTLGLIDALVDAIHPGTAIIIASRRMPGLSLSLRRARGEVAEFHLDDLLLDEQAIDAALSRVGIKDRPTTEQILGYSGGWAAAVQLAVHSIAKGRWRQLRPVDPSFAELVQGVHDFFEEGVFDELPSELQSFLMATSLLPELTVDDCNLITGRSDSVEFLNEIVLRDLFVYWFGDDASRCCYHDLFAEFLRARLKRNITAGELVELQRKAASCAPTGDAIQILAEAGDVEAAAELLTKVGREEVVKGCPYVPDRWIQTVPLSLYAKFPWVGLLAALQQVRRGQMKQAQPKLEAAVDAFKTDNDQLGMAAAKFALLEALMGQGEMAYAADLLNELSASTLPADDRIRYLVIQMWFQLFRCEWLEIGIALEEAFDLAIRVASEVGRQRLALGLGTEMFFVDQGPEWLRNKCAELASLIPDESSPAQAALVAMRASSDFLACRFRDALLGLDRAATVSEEHGGIGWLDLMIDRTRLGVALATGDHATTRAICDLARAKLETSAIHYQERAMYAFATARSGSMQGDFLAIRDARDRWLPRVNESDRPEVSIARNVLDAMLARSEGSFELAQRLLESELDASWRLRFSILTGQPSLELASLMLDLERPQEAVQLARQVIDRIVAMNAPGLLLQEGPGAYSKLLDKCIEAGIHTAFLSRVQDLSARSLALPRKIRVPGTGAVLSPREVEVLIQVAEGDSNRTIAEKLHIGERTVKSHMTTLFRKLDVVSRTQAAAKAREIGIVGR